MRHAAGLAHTLAWYVAPHDLAATLADMASVLGSDRNCVVARELTKVTLRRHGHRKRGRVHGTALAPALCSTLLCFICTVSSYIQHLWHWVLSCGSIACYGHLPLTITFANTADS